MKKKVLYIVIPCYNEEEVINDTIEETCQLIDKLIAKKLIDKDSKVLLVNDGSKDNTWNIIKKYYKSNKKVLGVSLSRNFGQQNAIMCGLMNAKEYADFTITLDADLQDDIGCIEEMINKYYDGNEIVYGVRKSRKRDSFLKRVSAQLFYKFLKKLNKNTIYNHADFRLVSKEILNELALFEENNLYLRGLFPLIGFKSDIVYYERKQRQKGKTKYSWKKMFNLAIDGITSVSFQPIRLIFKIGIIIFLLSILMIAYSVGAKIMGKTVSGWTFIVCSIWMIAGIQMLSLGIIGEYIGKIYSESKKRPRYIIEEQLLKDNNHD